MAEVGTDERLADCRIAGPLIAKVLPICDRCSPELLLPFFVCSRSDRLIHPKWSVLMGLDEEAAAGEPERSTFEPRA